MGLAFSINAAYQRHQLNCYIVQDITLKINTPVNWKIQQHDSH